MRGAVGIGALMAISNLYIGLKIGMYLGRDDHGRRAGLCHVQVAFGRFSRACADRPLNMLENCTIMTSASASGSLSAGAMIAAIPALYLCTGQPMPALANDGLAACDRDAGLLHGRFP